MRYSSISRSAGLTLLELMIVIAIIGIAATIAAPSLQQLLKNNRVATQNNELIALITLAKSQAIRRNQDWQIEFVSNGFAWSANVRPPAGENVDPVDDAGCPEITGVIRCASLQGVSLTGPERLTFNNRGFLEQGPDNWGAEILTLEHRGCSGNRQAREIEVLPTGQVTSRTIACPSG